MTKVKGVLIGYRKTATTLVKVLDAIFGRHCIVRLVSEKENNVTKGHISIV